MFDFGVGAIVFF